LKENEQNKLEAHLYLPVIIKLYKGYEAQHGLDRLYYVCGVLGVGWHSLASVVGKSYQKAIVEGEVLPK
jgi:hypothetical protein